jgi:hypothetical protein
MDDGWQREGSKGNNVSFLDGVLFAPLFVQKTVPHLQKTYMADACHLNFGKYTLFSCYSVTANSNMSPVGLRLYSETRTPATGQSFGSMC